MRNAEFLRLVAPIPHSALATPHLKGEPEGGGRFLFWVPEPMCQECEQHPARVRVTRTVGREETTFFLCAACARDHAARLFGLSLDEDVFSDGENGEWEFEFGFSLGAGDGLDEQISGAPFEVLMNACFANDGFDLPEDDDIFGGDDPFADSDGDEDAETELAATLFGHIRVPPSETDAACPGCGGTWAQIAGDERAGCPQCYVTFRAGLAALLEQVQRQAHHKGKTPRAARGRQLRLEHLRKRRDHQLELLRNRLSDAVRAERYEEAASLRDRIKVVWGGGI